MMPEAKTQWMTKAKVMVVEKGRRPSPKPSSKQRQRQRRRLPILSFNIASTCSRNIVLILFVWKLLLMMDPSMTVTAVSFAIIGTTQSTSHSTTNSSSTVPSQRRFWKSFLLRPERSKIRKPQNHDDSNLDDVRSSADYSVSPSPSPSSSLSLSTMTGSLTSWMYGVYNYFMTFDMDEYASRVHNHHTDLVESMESIMEDQYEKHIREQWEQLERDIQRHQQRFQHDMNRFSETIEQTVTQLEDEITEFHNQVSKDIVEFQHHVAYDMAYVQNQMYRYTHKTWIDFQRYVLKQRAGIMRWIRSVRNHLGVLLGVGVVYGGPQCGILMERSSMAIQSGQVTWTFLSSIGSSTTWIRNIITNRNKTSDDSNKTEQQKKQISNQHRAEWKQDLALLLKDTLVLTIAIVTAKHNYVRATDHSVGRPTNTKDRSVTRIIHSMSRGRSHQVMKSSEKQKDLWSIFQSALPIITIAQSIESSVRRILHVLLQEDQNESHQQHYSPGVPDEVGNKTKLRRWNGRWRNSQTVSNDTYQSSSSTTHDERLSRFEQNIIIWANTVGGILFLTFISSSVVPLPVIAASCAGTKLLLDSVSDEVVHNWFSMLQHIGPERLVHRLSNMMYKRFEKSILYPVQEAFEEIDSMVNAALSYSSSDHGIDDNPKTTKGGRGNGSDDELENPKFRRRISQAVKKSFKLKIFWMISLSGIAVQTLVSSHGTIRSFIQGIFVSRKKS